MAPPVNVFTSWRDDLPFEYPASPVTTDSSVSPFMTPASSRRPSITLPCMPGHELQISTPAVSAPHSTKIPSSFPTASSGKTLKRSASPSGSESDEGVHPSGTRDAKKAKEKRARKDFSEISQDGEDLTEIQAGWKPKKAQSAGNGLSAGLTGDKKDNQCGQTGLLAYLMDKAIQRAYWEDIVLHGCKGPVYPNVNAVKADMRTRMDFCTRDGNGPLVGTMFDSGEHELRCEREKNGKGCKAHPNDPAGRASWIHCRKTRHVSTHQDNVDELIARCEEERSRRSRHRL